MAKKKAAKKKSVVGKKSVASRPVPKALPMPVMKSKEGEDLLCKISLVFAVLFLLSALEAWGVGTWIITTSWWIWLLLSILFGLKPALKYFKK